MEYRVDGAEGVWKLESEGMGAQLGQDGVRSKILLGELLGGSCGVNELCPDVDEVFNLEVWCRKMVLVCLYLVLALGFCDVGPECGVEFLQIYGIILSSCGTQVALQMDCNGWVVTLISEERRYSGGHVGGIVVGKLCKRKELGPVVLLIVAVHLEVKMRRMSRTS